MSLTSINKYGIDSTKYGILVLAMIRFMFASGSQMDSRYCDFQVGRCSSAKRYGSMEYMYSDNQLVCDSILSSQCTNAQPFEEASNVWQTQESLGLPQGSHGRRVLIDQNSFTPASYFL